MPPAEVFLSHSSEDFEMAGRIASALVLHGVPVFYSPRNILGAQQWQDEILRALRRCEWFLVLLSPSAVNSMWVKREIAYALMERRYENRILPLGFRPCDMGQADWLKLFQIIDFSQEFDRGCRELLRTWGIGFRPDLLQQK